MIFDLNSEIDRQKLDDRVAKAKNQLKRVEFTIKAEKRTMAQNRYIHVLLGYFALEMHISLDEAKLEYFKKLVNRDIFIINKTLPLIGDVVIIRSSADITDQEMTLAIDRFITWSKDIANIPLPKSTDYLFIQEAELRVSQNEYWLNQNY